jgi:hypothetical protein
MLIVVALYGGVVAIAVIAMHVVMVMLYLLQSQSSLHGVVVMVAVIEPHGAVAAATVITLSWPHCHRAPMAW